MGDTKQVLTVPAGLQPSLSVVQKAQEFLHNFETLEGANGVPLLLLRDERSRAFYLVCHIDAYPIASKADLEAVLDPDESEDYKFNRNLYTDTYAYRLMADDAKKGRSFEDLVVEYDTAYRSDKPLKVFGGQHRVEAIREALKGSVHTIHGIRVYFCLSIEQRVDIATANNTAIAVSNDLLDRMQEDFLGSELRSWCQRVGLLGEGQSFADRRSADGVLSVRIARTLLVNFHRGTGTQGEGSYRPIVCSTGPGIDEDYSKLRQEIDWNDEALERMGREFARLHQLQRERVLKRDTDKYIEFANKAIHPCVTAAWASVAGLLQNDSAGLANHYALADMTSGDPLNAKALSRARLKGVDPDTYRGLGARINADELGRMLELFMLHATRARQRGITPDLANAAIKSYEAKKARRAADQALKGI